MNNVLELKGKRFVQASKSDNRGGGPDMNSKTLVTNAHICELLSQLYQVQHTWSTTTRPFPGVLVSVCYNKIVAKSNRIAGLFKGSDSNVAIVGAKFNKDKDKHIITYYITTEDIEKSIALLKRVNTIIGSHFGNEIDKTSFKKEEFIAKVPYKQYDISKSLFKQVVADVSYIDAFKIEEVVLEKQQSIVTLYDIGIEVKELLSRAGINILSSRILDNCTVYLDASQMEDLFTKMPYLVSMSTVDLSNLSPDDFMQKYTEQMVSISAPTIEPTIGVIDTLFDEQVYFHEWVEYHDLVDENIPRTSADYRHGTAVSSIIVDGSRLNPWLNDGCGKFRVRHFGVATSAGFSSFTIMKQIKRIVVNNQDIKVWNISLGSNTEINDNFISAEAAVLDQIQYENDVIFVVAGTNKSNDSIEKIGSPADSINSMVVNAVTKSGLSPKYARKGLALSFFAKPDISYYGGSQEQYIRVCEPLGAANVAGTSFAAPWIARKLSYLIDILGLRREIAKALLIDSARGWNEQPTPEEVALYGHGVVPIHINEIIQTANDEIKFLVSDVSEKWNTYNYHFPVPLKENKYPYIARATMCYFPKCDRTQGVDYTNTELNMHFGQMKSDGKINDIKGDKQNTELDDTSNYLLEGAARARFRKWDNVKYIVERSKKRMRPKESYNNKHWGMEIKTSNRLNPQDGMNIRFGVVVTLKEMYGVNRIDDFIKDCTLNGWLVKVVDIDNRIDIHKKVNEDIEFT